MLLRRSSSHPKQGLHMDLPGGIIEENEQPMTALIREIEEETGFKLTAENLKLIFTLTEEYDEKSAIRLIYAASLKHTKPEVSLSWEHDQFHWLPSDEAILKLEDGRYTRKGLQYIKDNKILTDL